MNQKNPFLDIYIDIWELGLVSKPNLDMDVLNKCLLNLRKCLNNVVIIVLEFSGKNLLHLK